METTDTHTYDGTVDEVLDMFGNEQAVIARYESMGHRDIEVLECERDEQSVRVRSRRVVDVDLPGFAKKVLSPTNTMVQSDQWIPADDGAWDGSFEVEVDAPIELHGKMRLTPNGERSEMTLTISMKVKVPVIGNKIADWVGKNDVRTTMEAEFAAGDAWLAAH